MVLYLRRSGGQSQYSELLCAQSEGAGAITSLVRWAVENLTEDLSVSKLAERACMSERTFAREFAKHYTEAPGAFFRNLRLERACVLLETTNWPIKTIAESSGFGSADALERAYRKRFDTPPSQTRKHFGRRF
jgi:transcriptional regulator GlxA family with amidase domain